MPYLLIGSFGAGWLALSYGLWNETIELPVRLVTPEASQSARPGAALTAWLMRHSAAALCGGGCGEGGYGCRSLEGAL